MIYTIDAPHFNAGIEYDPIEDRVVNAAPIIGYMIGWSLYKVEGYCVMKGWKIYGRPLPVQEM